MDISFAQKLTDAIKTMGMRNKEMAERLGVRASHISMLVNGGREPSEQLAKLLDHIIEEHHRAVSSVKLLPVYASIPAGWPSDCHVSEEPIGYVPYEGNGHNKGALLVDGHSMSPEIKHGEFVIYIEEYNIKPGDIVVATNEFSKPMVKEYALKNGEPWLVSLNPEYSNHKVNEHYRIIGKVVEVYNRRKLGR